MKVGSNVKRKPRYWVEDDGKVLFESDDASEAIQWAIDHAGQIELNGEFELKEPINVTTGTIIKGKRKLERREAV
ncbi:MAG: hypothetical protein DRJ03_03955 [Chloroflexi bacterium]|nr:MAG: hypothetical protein DRJ03_03955 [Chloroflexota bacterium]